MLVQMWVKCGCECGEVRVAERCKDRGGVRVQVLMKCGKVNESFMFA